jgi:hypothetical protein
MNEEEFQPLDYVLGKEELGDQCNVVFAGLLLESAGNRVMKRYMGGGGGGGNNHFPLPHTQTLFTMKIWQSKRSFPRGSKPVFVKRDMSQTNEQ